VFYLGCWLRLLGGFVIAIQSFCPHLSSPNSCLAPPPLPCFCFESRVCWCYQAFRHVFSAVVPFSETTSEVCMTGVFIVLVASGTWGGILCFHSLLLFICKISDSQDSYFNGRVTVPVIRSRHCLLPSPTFALFIPGIHPAERFGVNNISLIVHAPFPLSFQLNEPNRNQRIHPRLRVSMGRMKPLLSVLGFFVRFPFKH